VSLPVLVTYYYPHFLALVFLAVLWATPMSEKRRFFCRALTALLIALILAHLNRWFDLWPAHRYFASGHMTFCLGLSLSLGRIRPWTLLVTLPLLIPLGIALVMLHFHSVGDVLGAFLIVALVYGGIHRRWPHLFSPREEKPSQPPLNLQPPRSLRLNINTAGLSLKGVWINQTAKGK
jgi:membrane-associated phospholipid phosphatase